MTNRFRQGLFNKLNEKEVEIEKEIEEADEKLKPYLRKLHNVEEIRNRLEENTTLTNEEFEKLERRIENL